LVTKVLVRVLVAVRVVLGMDASVSDTVSAESSVAVFVNMEETVITSIKIASMRAQRFFGHATGF